jgi:hypothetical protein
MTRKTPEPPVDHLTRQTSAISFSPKSAESAPVPSTRTHVPPAAVIDVLIEQIEYLIAHADHSCPGCADCVRLEQAKHYLLMPFLSPPPATVV